MTDINYTKPYSVYKKAAAFLAAALLTAAAFCFLFRSDNKYTLRAAVTQDGLSLIDASALADGHVISLADGWEFYPGILPDQEGSSLSGSTPIRTFIGHYLNFSEFNRDGSPYGDAAYRAVLRSEVPGTYMLYLPEIYSACSVSVQGKTVSSSGSLSPYRPLIRDLCVPVSLEGDTSIVVRTSNYSHYYSGMIFPPILGTADSIGQLIGHRMIFYGFLCFTSLSIALFSAAVWMGTKKKRDPLSLLFAGMALSFSIRIAYPFFRLTGVPLIRPLYALEDGAALFGIWCAFGIVLTLLHLDAHRGAGIFLRLHLGMMTVVVLFPSLILPYFPLWTGIYGLSLTWYKLLSGLLLLLLVLSIPLRRGSLWMAAGAGVYGMGLAASALFINRFEPIRGGWTDEYGSFALVLCFAVLMVERNRAMVLENERLTDHLKEEVSRQTAQITGLVEERQRLLSEFLHDLKSPAAAILNYIELIRDHQILLGGEDREKLDSIERKCRSLSDQVLSMQKFTLENPLSLHKESLELCAFLSDFHRYLKPDIELEGPDFLLHLPPSGITCPLSGDAGQLFRLLENLIYNAADFTPPDGTILLSLDVEPEEAVIRVTDSGCGIGPDILPHLFDRFYTTRKGEGGQGLGLYIVKTVAAAHGGSVTAESTPGKGSVFTVRLPL